MFLTSRSTSFLASLNQSVAVASVIIIPTHAALEYINTVGVKVIIKISKKSLTLSLER